MSEWELVKERTASAGAVWRSADGQYFKRTGGSEVTEESGHQSLLSELGFPVPQPTQSGTDGTLNYFIEPSAGQRTLHELALEQGRASNGRVGDALVDRAAQISAKLLQAQARNPLPTDEVSLRRWFSDAGFTGVVFAENPDLDTPVVHSLIDQAVDRAGVKSIGYSNLAARVPAHASKVYSTNLTNLVEEFWDKDQRRLVLKPEDEIIKGCLVTHEGKISNATLAGLGKH